MSEEEEQPLVATCDTMLYRVPVKGSKDVMMFPTVGRRLEYRVFKEGEALDPKFKTFETFIDSGN